MKKLFRKFFSLDEPAKGAFFGLTALMAWLWLRLQYGNLYADCKQVNAMQVFSPGANAVKSYDDIRFFIRLKTPSNK
ncbi:MAG: hypothetical protein IJS08_15160 [Victivallales bacterium]|nr:hypothetical protein [Victivallales bacterium]